MQTIRNMCLPTPVWEWYLSELLFLPSYSAEASLEEPVDLFSLRVQVDVVETRPGGQTRNGGHLGGTARESSF